MQWSWTLFHVRAMALVVWSSVIFLDREDPSPPVDPPFFFLREDLVDPFGSFELCFLPEESVFEFFWRLGFWMADGELDPGCFCFILPRFGDPIEPFWMSLVPCNDEDILGVPCQL